MARRNLILTILILLVLCSPACADFFNFNFYDWGFFPIVGASTPPTPGSISGYITSDGNIYQTSDGLVYLPSDL